MAKGQKRSNRELKKPKQDKVPPKPHDPFASKTAPQAGTAVTTALRGKNRL